VTDFPLLGGQTPDVLAARKDASLKSAAPSAEPLSPVRGAAPFEALRDRAEAKAPRASVFFANLGSLAQFGPRAQFARNLFAAGGVGSVGEKTEYATRDAMIEKLRENRARVALICGADAVYAEHGENAAQRL